MGVHKKLEETKDNFLVLCEQYNAMGTYFKMEARAIEAKDKRALVKTVQSRNLQFQEMGEQLKMVGAALDRMGGRSVMHAPPPNGFISQGIMGINPPTRPEDN